ncbi:MAG TPA: VWA domain-containing protein [Terriglobia bacterium]|nr:VWA domain-containing protein [Terriglobia bacterium]
MKYAIAAATAILAGLTLAAQTPTTLRVDVRLVNVVATVTDAKGKFIPDLKPEDFTILEDGVPQKITHFTQDRDVPVSVGILLDTSGSMAGKMRAATAAVERFLHNIHANDDIFLMTFARNIVVEQDFTSDRRRLAKALSSLNVGGSTLLYDGLIQAIGKVEKGRHDKRAVLVISDGIDAGSKAATLDALLRTIRGAEVLVYGLGTSQTVYADPNEHVPFTLPTPSSASRGPAAIANRGGGNRGRGSSTVSGVNMTVMNQFADNSGGRAFLLADTFIDEGTSEIDRILNTIAEELRGQYTLGYYPSASDNGEFHTIKVTTRRNDDVRARTGYHGRP